MEAAHKRTGGEAARVRLLLKGALIALAAFVLAAAFSAYLRPDMLAAFADVMAFCAAILK